MAKQNIYDNEEFFENFKNKRENEVNFNDMIESPILIALLPNLCGKTMLDIGCGMGQHAKQYSDMGAKSVLGIDISKKMLAYANGHNNADNITYTQMAMEDLCKVNSKFDVITSSLVFDYIEDFAGMMRMVYSKLNDGGHFVFSMSHPMATAYDGKYDRYTRTESGERLYANVRNYWIEGLRKVKWIVDDYEVYHRTLTTIINAIIKAGFVITECQESQISDELREKYPNEFGGTIHRSDFIFFSCEK